MKKLLATALFSAMVILPSYSAEQKPVKYELGNYNFSFDKQEETQRIELKNTEKSTNSEDLPQSVIDDKATILPMLKDEKPIGDANIKPVSKNIEIQQQVVQQIKQEEQTSETEKVEENQCPTAVQSSDKEQNSTETAESAKEELCEPNDEQKTDAPCEEDNDEIKTPVPQSSVIPSKEDLKTNVKPHNPMPTQKALDEAHSSAVDGITPVKRVVQPTKPPAKEQPKAKISEDEILDEFTFKDDTESAENKVQTIQNSEKSVVDAQNDGAKKEEQKVKEKKKLPFTFELQKMQYSGADSRQL